MELTSRSEAWGDMSQQFRIQIAKPCPHWRGDNLSPNSATVAVFGDSRRIRRQYGQMDGWTE